MRFNQTIFAFAYGHLDTTTGACKRLCDVHVCVMEEEIYRIKCTLTLGGVSNRQIKRKGFVIYVAIRFNLLVINKYFKNII